MQQIQYPKHRDTIKKSLFSISILFTIMSFILTFIDKKRFDIYLILVLIISIVIIIILNVSVFKRDAINNSLAGIVLIGSIITFYFGSRTYDESVSNDFFEVCVYLNGVKMFSSFIYIILLLKDDEI